MRYDSLMLRVTPTPKFYQEDDAILALPETITVTACKLPAPLETNLLHVLRDGFTGLSVELGDEGLIHLRLRSKSEAHLPKEGYTLEVDDASITIVGADNRGLLYGAQTLAQIAGLQALCELPKTLPIIRITDWPSYPVRSFMPDLGRTVYSMDLLRRMVRICSALKLNVMHLHLHDNELNPVRYPGTPFGSENPTAHSLNDYAELMAYAADWEVEIMPEIESWGHVGSLLQHCPELYGASRLALVGHSFAVGPAMFDLLERLFDPWVDMLPDGAGIHVGLDETNWYRQPGADPTIYTPEAVPKLVIELMEARAKAHGKELKIHLWAETETNAKMSPDLRNRVTLMPWGYHTDRQNVPEALRRNAMPPAPMIPPGKGPARMICCMGSSSVHEHGALSATRLFMEGAKRAPNCQGGVVCQWSTNDVAERFLGLYAGAELLWEPDSLNAWYPSRNYESIAGDLTLRMKLWQQAVKVANPEALRRDQGPEIYHGAYRWGERAGERIAPLWKPTTYRRGDQAR